MKRSVGRYNRYLALLVLSLAFILVSCNSNSPSLAPTPAKELTKPVSQPTISADKIGRPLRVGFVTGLGSITDKSFNQATFEGILLAQKEFGGDVKYVEPKDMREATEAINLFVDDGYDVIVTTGFVLAEATTAAAKANPATQFIGVDQFQAQPIANLTGLVFEEDKAGYLAGALAALMSRSRAIGGIFGTDVEPSVWRFGEGFKAGARAIDHNIDLRVVYHSDVDISQSFNDPEWGKTIALSIFDKGADIIFTAAGNTSTGVLFATAERRDSGVLCIGVDTDQYLTVPEARPVLLSSAMKLITPGVFRLLEDAHNGSLKGGNRYGDVGLAPFHDLDSEVSVDIKAKLIEIDADLKSGALKTNVSPTKP